MQSTLESPTARNLRPLLRTLALAAIMLAVPPAYAAPLDDASQAFKSGQHAKALELVDKHLAGQPKDAQGRFLKGLILTGMNKQAEAITVFRKLTEDYPELPEPYNNLAVIYAQQKQYDKARDALEQAIRTHPAYATAHENLGDIYSRLASQAYGKALSIDSSNASAQTKLSMINDLVGTGKATVATPTAAPSPTVLASAKPVEPLKPPATMPVPPAPAAKLAAPEAKPADTKPVPPPPPAAAPPAAAKPASLEGEITSAVDAWLAAWSKKDVKAYLAYYAQDFETPRGLSRKDWETERAQRVGKHGQIEVGRDKLAIKADAADKVTVRFRQSYRSASFKSSSGKVLVLIKRDGKWLIQKEQAG